MADVICQVNRKLKNLLNKINVNEFFCFLNEIETNNLFSTSHDLLFELSIRKNEKRKS
jgi:hypothetical protein